MIVIKFGGTSVEDRAAIERSCGIVEARVERKPLVVVSALAGTTNGLLEACGLAAARKVDAAKAVIATLEQRHLTLLPSLAPHFDQLRSIIDAIGALGELSPRTQDMVASYGEVMSSLIFTDTLRKRGTPAEHLDARECVVTDNRFLQASPLMEQTEQQLSRRARPLLDGGKVVVMGGFIGATEDGVTTTLGRGGSDYSASIAGAALAADEIQIWTDVDGMLTADPRVVPGAWKIREISFAEASELAYFGAKVLHPLTVLPAVERGIPVYILNSRKPEGAGTRISTTSRLQRAPIKSIACKKGITVVTVTSSRMLMAHGFLKALFEVFNRHGASVDMIATSEVSVSLTLDNAKSLEKIRPDLERLGDVREETDMALICLVGRDLKQRPGILDGTFSAVRDINVSMISYGASNINLSFLVQQKDADRAVRQLHAAFFRDFDPEVFEEVSLTP